MRTVLVRGAPPHAWEVMNEAVEEMMKFTEKAEAATASLPHGQALGCTELQAAWCPVHGDCKCDGSGHYIEWNPFCILHPEDIWTKPDEFFPDDDPDHHRGVRLRN